jgi:hypothetical protein
VLVGGYERLTEQPIAASSGADFILFTDDPAIRPDTWQVRREELVLPQDPARSSRRVKLLPHEALSQYDVSIYVDNRVILRRQPEQIIADLLPDGAVFALNAHDERESVEDEFERVARWHLDASWVLQEQLEHYRDWHPDVLRQRPLWTGFMVRRHLDPAVARMGQIWWTQLLRYSRRDQLSVNLALEEAGLVPNVLHYRAVGSQYHEWLAESAVRRDHARTQRLPGNAELDACRSERERAQEHLRVLQAGNEALSQQLVTLRARTETMRDAQGAILGSHSWRATAPLRWLGDRVRRR